MGRPDPWVRVIMALLTLTGLALAAWAELPEWQRELIIRQARDRLKRSAASAARVTGHRAMGDELAGRAGDARHGYSLAYRLSALRDRL